MWEQDRLCLQFGSVHRKIQQRCQLHKWSRHWCYWECCFSFGPWSWNQGFTVYMDRFYTSPILYKFLSDNGINACGTVMTNRWYFPVTIIRKKGAEERWERLRRCQKPIGHYLGGQTTDLLHVYVSLSIRNYSSKAMRKECRDHWSAVSCCCC